MATVTGYTAARMKAIEDGTVVDGDIVGSNLILTKFNGSQIDAGVVVGPQGPTGPTGPSGSTGGTVRIPHTWHIPGEVKVASGDQDYILPFYVPVPPGRTVKFAGDLVCGIRSGSSVSFDINLNGSVVTNGQVATTAPAFKTNVPQTAIGNYAAIYLVVSAVSGTPKNFFVSLFLDYTFPGAA